MKRFCFVLFFVFISLSLVSANEFFTFQINTTSPSENFSFQVDNSVGVYIDWNDSNSEFLSDTTGIRSHVYASPGVYNISMNGSASRISFYEGTPSMLVDILTPVTNGTHGVTGINSSNLMFGYSNNIVNFTAEDFFDVASANVTDMKFMFTNADKFNGNISGWNTSSVTDMSYMFQFAYDFNHSINSWDTSKVTDMSYMFRGATDFNQPLNSWDTSKVTNMYYMFYGAYYFNQPLNSWDTSKVTNMYGMFRDANFFNQNITSWDTSNVTNMGLMFQQANSFNQPIGSWDVSKVSNSMFQMFWSADSFDKDLSFWNVSSVTNMGLMFDSSGLSSENYSSTLVGWNNLSSLESSVSLGAGDIKYSQDASSARQNLIDTYSWTINDGGADFFLLNDSNSFVFQINTTTDYQNFSFQLDNSDVQISWGDGVNDTYSGTGLASHNYTTAGIYNISINGTASRISFSEGTEDLLIDILTPMHRGVSGINSTYKMFMGAANIVNFTASDWLDVASSNITNMYQMFWQASNFNQDLDGWDTSNVTTMYGMFYQAYSFNGNVSTWDVSNVENMEYMFGGASSFNSSLSGWNTSSLYNIKSMFYQATSFNQPINHFDVSHVNNFYYLFREASNFSQDLDNWNTSNLSGYNELYATFFLASSFNGNISTWDVSGVTTMNSVFTGSSFDGDVSNWNTSSVTTMEQMFQNTPFNGNISGWDVSSVSSMTRMFNGATNFNQNLTEWDTSNVYQMVSMFENAAAFNGNISTWDTSANNHFSRMFDGATSFNQPLDNWDVSQCSSFSNMFDGATSFNQNLTSWDTSSATSMMSMFKDAVSFNGNISNWDISGVTQVRNMFDNASSFDQDLGSWNFNAVTDFDYFLSHAGLSVENYDSFLVRINALNVVDGVFFYAPGLQYSVNGTAARQGVIDTDSWTFSGDSLYTVPKITVLSPLNATYTYTSPTISFNANSTRTINTWIVNYNGTNVTLPNINYDLNVEDGDYHLLLYGNSSEGEGWLLNDSIHFRVNTTIPEPYINISTIEDLYNIRDYADGYVYGYYNLTNDLNFSDNASYADPNNKTQFITGAGWSPIGNSSAIFKGHFNGNGYTISDLYISGGSNYGTGLFGSVNNSIIENLTLENFDVSITGINGRGSVLSGYIRDSNISDINIVSGEITSNQYSTGGVVSQATSSNFSNILIADSAKISVTQQYAGGVAGQATSSNFTNITFLGNVSSTTYYVGGIIGRSFTSGMVRDSYISGSVSTTNGRYAGGVVGYAPSGFEILNAVVNNTIENISRGSMWVGGISGYGGTIINSSVFGNVAATSYYAGGISGQGYIIINSSFYGNVYGASYVGGISGNSGNINNSIAAGNISGTGNYVGGILGANGNIFNSSFYGNIYGASYVGGLVGQISSGQIIDSYVDEANISSVGSAGGIYGGSTGTSPLSNSFFNYENTTINGVNSISSGGLPSDLFYDWLSGGKNADIDYYFQESGGFYLINNESDFRKLLLFGQSTPYDFQLVNSLDLSGENGLYIPSFKGTFDGNDRTISNINLTQSNSTNNIGLFGFFNGSIYDLSLDNVDVIGYSNIGGLVGEFYGSISNVDISNANVSGYSNIGGLTGYTEYSEISNSYYNGSVEASYRYVGGLAGYGEYVNASNSYSICPDGYISSSDRYAGGLFGYFEYGVINNTNSSCYVFSNSGDYVGGLIGESYESTIENSFSAGNVTGFGTSEWVGGLIGQDQYSNITNSYANGNVTSYGYSGGLVGYPGDSFINNSYATGNVNATSGGAGYSGGLAGWQWRGVINNSYATGDVYSYSGSWEMGGLVGYSNDGAVIENSYATGNVNTSADDVGGLVGYSYNMYIANSYATGNIHTSESNAGGLVGYNQAYNITNSYATGNVTADSGYSGGLIGYNRGPVRRSFSTGYVSGSSNIGGLVGSNLNSVNDSFWDINTSGMVNSSGGEGKSTLEMQDISTFSNVDWNIISVEEGIRDIAYVWNIVNGSSYPFLSFETGRGSLACEESWDCTDWSTCVDGTQTRTCIDTSDCGTELSKPVVSQSCTVDDGSSSGGGGSGIATGTITEEDETENIVTEIVNGTAETSFDIMNPGEKSIITINDSSFGLTQISMNVSEEISGASVSITEVDNKDDSSLMLGVGEDFATFEAFNVEKNGISNDNISEVTLNFRVTKEWVNEKFGDMSGFARTYMRMYKRENVGDAWDEVETEFLSEDNTYYYYEAVSDGFSIFVIGLDTSILRCEVGEERCVEGSIRKCVENGNETSWDLLKVCDNGCKDANSCAGFKFDITYLIFGGLVLVFAGLIVVIVKFSRDKPKTTGELKVDNAVKKSKKIASKYVDRKGKIKKN